MPLDDTNFVKEWMKANPDKYQAMCLGNYKQTPSIECSLANIPIEDKIKLLGTILDNKLIKV